MNTSPAPIIVDPPKPPKPSLMRRLLKKMLIVLACAFGLVLLTSVIIAAFFEKEIGERLLSEINKQLKTELRVSSFELSLLSGFPKVAANLNEVTLDDAMKGTLLEANNVSFRFGLLSLLTSDVKIHSVLIEDGALYVHIDRKGRLNYDILAEEESPTESAEEELATDFAISLDEAILQDIELIYIDERANQEIKWQVGNATASGEFSSEAFSMTTIATVYSDFVEMKDGRYLVGKKLTGDAKMNVDLTNRKYEFEEMILGVSENLFAVEGTIETKGSATDFDLNIAAKEGSIESVIDLLPEQHLAYFSDFESRGNFVFNATINGLLDTDTYPAINLDFGLEDGQINSPRLSSALKDVSFKGGFTNGKYKSNRTSKFHINDFTAHLHRQLVESKLTVYNFDDPAIDLRLSGVLPLEDIYGLFNMPSISGADGEVEINDLLIKGRVKDMATPSRISKVKTGGTIEFDDASLDFKGKELLFDKGEIQIINNSIVVKEVKIEAPNTEIELDGKFVNVIPVLLADSLNTKKAELKFQADLYAPSIDLDELMSLMEEPVQAKKGFAPKISKIKQKRAVILKRERLTKLLKGTFKARIDEFNYEKIEGSRFKGDLQFDNNELLVKGNCEAMEGAFKLDGKVFFEKKPYMKAEVEMAGIDVREFFRQFENFGQEVVQSKHLKGDLQSQLLVNAYWAANGTFLYDKLNVLGAVNLTEGELIDLSVLYDFSKYVKIEDLRHIKFEHLQNWFEVSKGKLTIPVMFLQSNAMNLDISGEHTFENGIDYNMKINAGQVLINKFKRYNKNMAPQKAERSGWFNLFYRIYGTVDKYQVSQDKRTVKRRFAVSEHHKREIKTTLLREFGRTSEAIENTSRVKEEVRDTRQIIDPIQPKEEVKEDPPIVENPTSVEEEDEYLFEEEGLEGGSSGGEDEYLEWEEEGGGG